MSIEMLNFGCRLNISEAEVMRRRAEEAGLGALEGGAIVVNTCAVTSEAVRQARQAIRRAKRLNPDARVIVSGCAAQTEGEAFGAMDEVDLVIGNADKLDARAYRALPDFGLNSSEKVRVNDIFETRENAPHMVDAIEGRTRAFVQVQNGCDHRCTFCIIPYARGAARSVPAGGAVEQVRRLVDEGYREVVLTGVDLTSWGGDLPGAPKLGRLVQAVLAAVPALERLRLSSIDSIEVDPALMETFGEPRLMPHLHLSLQHGHDMILKRMKRRHGRDDAVRFCEEVRAVRPEMAFGADLIAGFPTETSEMHESSLALIQDCDLSFLHVFPFSARPGTPAARMPALDGRVVKARAAELRAAGRAATERALAATVGKCENVLIEAGGRRGRTERFMPVAVDRAHEPGTIVPLEISGVEGDRLVGSSLPLAA